MKSFRCDRVRPNNGIVEAFLSRRSTDGQDEHALLNLVKDDYPEFDVGAAYDVSVQPAQDRVVTLRFVEQEHGFFTRLMGLAQYGLELSHVDAQNEDGTKYIGAHLFGGVQELPEGYDAGKFKEETFVRMNMTSEQEAAFFNFLRRHLHEPYDPIAVLYFWGPFAGRNWHDPGAWECTLFIAAALIASGWLPVNEKVPAGKLTPRDLYWLTSTIAARRTDG